MPIEIQKQNKALFFLLVGLILLWVFNSIWWTSNDYNILCSQIDFSQSDLESGGSYSATYYGCITDFFNEHPEYDGITYSFNYYKSNNVFICDYYIDSEEVKRLTFKHNAAVGDYWNDSLAEAIGWNVGYYSSLDPEVYEIEKVLGWVFNIFWVIIVIIPQFLFLVIRFFKKNAKK